MVPQREPLFSRPEDAFNKNQWGWPMKFLHAADLHVDSPLRGLDSCEGAPWSGCEARRAWRLGARRARELAEQTGTNLVVSRDGAIGYLAPKSENTVTSVQGPLAPYADK